jgi:hypothetical protein
MNGDVRWPGYPPSDKELRKWLINKEDDQLSAFRRSCALSAGLFQIVRRWLHHEQSKHQSDVPIAGRFRAAMADGMTFTSHGDFRKAFFKEVIATANHVSGTAWCLSTLMNANRSTLKRRPKVSMRRPRVMVQRPRVSIWCPQVALAGIYSRHCQMILLSQTIVVALIFVSSGRSSKT